MSWLVTAYLFNITSSIYLLSNAQRAENTQKTSHSIPESRHSQQVLKHNNTSEILLGVKHIQIKTTSGGANSALSVT